MPDPLRIVLAEDNYLVREDTRRLLEDSGEVDVVAAVGNADELRDAVRRFAPQAVLADIRMPPGHHMEGIEAAHAIRRETPRDRRRRAVPSTPTSRTPLRCSGTAPPDLPTCSRTGSPIWRTTCAPSRTFTTSSSI